jgi:GxxExxY protein
MRRDRWTQRVIEAAAEVHHSLGPGLAEPAYRLALAAELRRRKVPFEENTTVPIRYRDLVLVTGLQLDLVVGGELIVEVLSTDAITDWHRARVLTHLALSQCPRGLLINFNVREIRRGIRRIAAPRSRR